LDTLLVSLELVQQPRHSSADSRQNTALPEPVRSDSSAQNSARQNTTRVATTREDTTEGAPWRQKQASRDSLVAALLRRAEVPPGMDGQPVSMSMPLMLEPAATGSDTNVGTPHVTLGDVILR